MDYRDAVNELLQSGLSDWVQLYEVMAAAREYCSAQTLDEARRVSLQLLERCLARGLFEVGDVDQGGFTPWSVQGTQAVEHVRVRWPEGLDPEIGDICWLRITRAGESAAGAAGP